MTQQTPATPENPRSRALASDNDQRGAVLLGVLVALAALATALMLLSDNQVAMKLAIVTALWAAILGMFLVHSGRRRLQAQKEESAAVQRGLEEQLAQAERHHLQQQELLERQVKDASVQDETLKAIRDQLAEVRAQLEALSGIEFVEPTAIRAQARRVGELSSGTTPAQPVAEEPPALAEAHPVEPTEAVIPATPVSQDEPVADSIPAAPAGPAAPSTPAAPVTPATPVAPANPAAVDAPIATSATVTSVASVTETATVAVVETSAEDDPDSQRGSHRAGSVTVEQLKAARAQQERERAEALALRRANAEAVRQRRLAEERAAAHARETSSGGVQMLDEILPQLGGGGAAEETYRRNAIKDTIGERMDTGTFARQRWAEPEVAEPPANESSTGGRRRAAEQETGGRRRAAEEEIGGRRRAAEQETGGRRRKDERSESLSVADLLKKGKQQ